MSVPAPQRHTLRSLVVGHGGRLLLVTILLATLGSCGYSSKPLYNRNISTIAVPIFVNKSFRREWEFRLTEAICKDIDGLTPYKIVPQSRADTVLTGEIVDIAESVLTYEYGPNLPRETQLTIIVNFQWKDLRTGRVLVERKRFNRSATEIPLIGEHVADAQQGAVEMLARAIVEQLEKDW